MKAEVLIDGLNHNGEELKKGKTVELPWQIINNWSIRGWVKPIEEVKMMKYSLKLIQPPTQEPVTLEEVKTALRILESDFDDVIPGYIKTGREVAENYQGVCYLTQTWEQTFDVLPILPLTLPRIPLQSLMSVKLIDQDGVESSMDINDLIISSRSNRIDLKPGKSWPSITLQKFDSVIIQFVAGYSDASKVSESVKNFIKAYVGFRLDHPENEAIPENLYHLLTPNLGVAL